MPSSFNEIGHSPIISADKVRGTEVFNEADEKLGSIDSILIDKSSGEVAYVVMSFGGFLGIGEKYHPLPWEVLDYDTRIGGYRVDLDRDELVDAPSYDRESIDAYDYARDAGGIDTFYADKFRRPEPLPIEDSRETGFFGAERRAPHNDRSAPRATSDQSDIDELLYKRPNR